MCAFGRHTLATVAVVAATALALAGLVAAQPVGLRSGPAEPQAPLPDWLFGANLIRADTIVKIGPLWHDYRLDLGRIKSAVAGVITLRERDDTVVPISVAPTAKIRVKGRATGFFALRRGMTAVVVRDGDAPAELVQASLRALPGAWLATTYFGPTMTRVEASVQAKGVLHDYRLDRGQIKALAPGTLTLRERDGLLVPVAIAPTARIKLNGQPASFAGLRKGMFATTVRDNEAPADTVLAYPQP
jgi:hypothetical protein